MTQIHKEFPGGMFCDADIEGNEAVLFPDAGIVGTTQGPLTPPPGQLPRFLCLTSVPTFQVAGQANAAIGTSWYHDGAWHLDPRVAHGENGCIFDLMGTLHIIEPAGGQTSQGYRYVAPLDLPAGRPILGDDTILYHEVSRWIDLSDAQDKSIVIGQGHNFNGAVVEIDGVERVLYEGEVYSIRARQKDGSVVVAFYEVLANKALKAHIFRLTVDELRALRPVIPPPARLPPKIVDVEYDVVLTAGEPWHFAFSDSSNATDYALRKDEKDRWWVDAINQVGEDHTGLVRPSRIVGPPCPEFIPMLKRNWLQPSIGSLDQAQLVADMSKLDAVDVVAIPVQQIHADVSTPQLGPNTYPNLVAAGFFKTLRDRAKPLVVEMGSVKDGDCQALANINGMQWAVQRVADAGGEIAGFSADEPLTNSRACHLTLEQIADGHANWHHAILALSPMQVGLLESWPDYTTLAMIETFFHLLDQRNARPNYFHADIFWDHSTDQKTAEFIKGCQQICDRYGVTFGVFINSTKDPIATDAAHDANLVALAHKVYGIHPSVAHVCVAAWALRAKDHPETQNVPNNLGANGLLDTFGKVHAIFKEVAPPVIPVPPEGDDMLYVKLIEDRDPLAVKEIKDVGGGESVLVLPDFDDPTIDPATNKPRGAQHNAVYSLQPVGPTGVDGYRPEGTAGAYEKCRVTGNTATFRPVSTLLLSRIFMLVTGS